MLSRCVISLLFKYLLQHLQYSFIITLVLLFKATGQNNIKSTAAPTCTTFSLKARHKSCFLRPDSGPCRADILQWYFDVKQNKCYEFYWGGCQGNGNRFETKNDCDDYCFFNKTEPVPMRRPFFCELQFDYGTCFGHYQRWYWDKYYKNCKRRIYSGCGGNQNNFRTFDECRAACIATFNPCKAKGAKT